MQLGERQADGATLRDHLLAAARSGAAPDPRLSERPPRGTEQVWGAYAALSGSRQPDVCIAPSEVLAWQRLHDVRLTPWEVETLEAVDRACVAVMRAQQAARMRK